MRCPKCGSEVETINVSNGKGLINYETFSPLTRCVKCYYELTYEDAMYQKRLDKVLAKFEDANHGIMSKRFIEDGAIEYSIKYNEFHWTSYSDDFVISLNTVESLIKDIESVVE